MHCINTGKRYWIKCKSEAFNSSPPEENGCDFTDIFRWNFVNEKFLYFDLNFTEVWVPKFPSDNNPALVQTMACICINTCIFHCYHQFGSIHLHFPLVIIVNIKVMKPHIFTFWNLNACHNNLHKNIFHWKMIFNMGDNIFSLIFMDLLGDTYCCYINDSLTYKIDNGLSGT